MPLHIVCVARGVHRMAPWESITYSCLHNLKLPVTTRMGGGRGGGSKI